MLELPAHTAHREWSMIRWETPMFWRLIMETSCHQCDHSPLTPVSNHSEHDANALFKGPPKVVGVIGLVDPRPVMGYPAESLLPESSSSVFW